RSSSGLDDLVQRPHGICQIAGFGLNEKLLVNVLRSSDIEPLSAAGIELLREVPFDPLSALPLQPLATFSLDAPTVGVHGFLLRLFALPVASTPLRFGHVGPDPHLGEANRDLVAVVSLVCHH